MRRILMLLALLALPAGATPGDGDLCPDPGLPVHHHPNERLVWRCRMLCDAAVGDGACAHMVFENLPLPWHVMGFEVKRTRDCDPNWAVDIRGVHNIDADPPETPFIYLTLDSASRSGILHWGQPDAEGPPQRIRVIRRNCAAGRMTVYVHLARLRSRSLGP